MMVDFDVSVIVEHGYPHYKIVDVGTGSVVHCDLNELDETINELSNTCHTTSTMLKYS